MSFRVYWKKADHEGSEVFETREEAYEYWYTNIMAAHVEDGLYQLEEAMAGDEWFALERRNVIFT